MTTTPARVSSEIVRNKSSSLVTMYHLEDAKQRVAKRGSRRVCITSGNATINRRLSVDMYYVHDIISRRVMTWRPRLKIC